MVYQEGVFIKRNLYIDDGRISDICEHLKVANIEYDYSGLQIIPGLIDPHVHFHLDVGGLCSADDFLSGGRAAAKGGVTTVLDFTQPIAQASELGGAYEKRMLEACKCPIDYGFHLTLGDFEGDIETLVRHAKALGMGSVKVFTTYAASKRKISDVVLAKLLDIDVITMVHAEDDALVHEVWADIATYEASRPLASELAAIDKLIQVMDVSPSESEAVKKGKLYVVHVSSGSGVALLKNHQNIFIESCPHYFVFDKDVYQTPEGANFMMAPPLRAKSEKEKLRGNFAHIHTIGTDHCPFKQSEKRVSKEPTYIPKGIGGIEYSFLLMYSIFGASVIDKMSSNPAQIFELEGKGALKIGNDADLFVFDPSGETLVDASNQGVDRYSPYDGMCLKGRVVATMSRGTFVWKDGVCVEAIGRYIRSGRL